MNILSSIRILYLLSLHSSPHVIIAGNHVTNDTGTGIVHTAPSHGMDDFTICVYHNIISLPGQTQSPLQTTIPQVSLPSSIPRYQVTEDVDENGCYFKTSWVPRLQGKPVLKEGNQEVVGVSSSLLSIDTNAYRVKSSLLSTRDYSPIPVVL